MKTLDFLRKQHRQALVNGETKTAEKIREHIRQEAKRLFDKGYTLNELI